MQSADNPLEEGAKASTFAELEPTLARATARLRTALSEACGTDLARANTGEFIRVEEVLAIANEAAKEVISVRRRLNGERRRISARVSAPEPTSSRMFSDTAGRSWRVFAVHPSMRVGRAAVRAAFADGWLTFECGEETRRLAPIPEEWQTADEATLTTLCERAERSVHRRRASDTGQPREGE
jgi:hypothetical protein